MSLLLPWAGLMALLLLEIAATLAHLGWITGLLGPAMVAIVLLAFIRIRTETPLSKIFALAALFWMAILLGLGGLDFMVRRNLPVPQTTSASQYR